MRRINNYIIEKLHIDKSIKSESNDEELASNIMKFVSCDNPDYYDNILNWIIDHKIINPKVFICTSDYDRHLSEEEKSLLNFIRNEIKYEVIKDYFKDITKKGNKNLLVHQRFPYTEIHSADNILQIELKKFDKLIYLTDRNNV